LFVADRLERIRQLLLESKTVTINKLCEYLKVSDVTIRKDFEKLESERFLRKIHGGAVLLERGNEFASTRLESIPDYDEKLSIVNKALTLIDEFDNIFIGPGSSCLVFAKMLNRYNNVRVVTNNMNTLPSLCDSVKRVYMLGGEVGNYDNMLYSFGEKDLPELENIFLNKAIVTYAGVDLETGFTLDEMSMVNVYKKVLSIAKKVIVLAPKYKFQQRGMYPVQRLEDIDYLVTSEKPRDDYISTFENGNVKILYTGDA
jgi:DeoR/GlpR family transcriptional regulator of sugar metabolism